MSTIELVRTLRTLGVHAAVAGGRLRLRGPAGFLTPEIAQAIEEHRAELMCLLHSSGAPRVERPEIGPRDRPLSNTQRQLWFEQQLHPESSHYNVPVVMRVAAGIGIAAVDQVLRWIVRRHPALRARFPIRSDRAVMEIAPERETFALAVVDLDRSVLDPAFERAVLECIRRPFDLSGKSLFRACLLRGRSGDSTLVVTFHHLLADGWSMAILMRDFHQAYMAVSRGRPIAAKQPARGEAGVDRRTCDASLIETAVARLRSVPDLALPHDRRRPEKPTFRGGVCTMTLCGADIERLATVARQCGTTLFAVFTAIYTLLLCHEADQERFAIGSVVAGRDDPDAEDVVGHFATQIVIVADLTADPTLEEVIERASAAVLRAHALRHVPFDALVKAMRAHGVHRSPLCRAEIVMQPRMDDGFAVPGFELQSVHHGTCKFELQLNVWLSPTSGGLALEYSRDVFTDAAGARFLEHTRHLIESVRCDGLAVRISTLRERLSQTEHARYPVPRLSSFELSATAGAGA